MIFFKTIFAYFQDKQYRDLLITTVIIIGFGSVIYHYLEGWSWIDSIYFSVITLTTIGFGDFAPATPEGKLFTIFYIVIGIGIILSFINTVYNHYDETKKKNKKQTKL
ncbi:potassium channel family protein [Polaribacter gochangensis]|uniref:potassium channel family protein n=1 Tax=Polaribacter gochangensis TaxID=3252903 RepID=UPI003904A5F1